MSRLVLLMGVMVLGAAGPVLAAADNAAWASPSSAAFQNRSASSPEEALFVEKCGMCHRERGMGTVVLARRTGPEVAMLERRTDLAPELIRLYVRTGAGNMPRIGRGEVSDAQLKVLIGYLSKGRP